MGKVGTGFSMSLDGFIADDEGNVGPLFDWYFAGDTEYEPPGGRFTLKVSQASVALLRSSYGAMGCWSWAGGTSTRPAGGAEGIPWTCPSSSSPTGWPKSGSTRDPPSPSSPKGSRPPWKRRRPSRATRAVGAGGVDGALGAMLTAACAGMENGSWERLKACANATCGWAFFDRSKNRFGR